MKRSLHIITAGEVTGYIMIALWDASTAEIFCIEAEDAAQNRPLIAAAVLCAFNLGKQDVLFMAEKESAQIAPALSAGFKVTGFYQAFRAYIE